MDKKQIRIRIATFICLLILYVAFILISKRVPLNIQPTINSIFVAIVTFVYLLLNYFRKINQPRIFSLVYLVIFLLSVLNIFRIGI